MTAYYNEIDPYAAQWLRNLIAENLIAKGEVDERSITEVQPSDLAGFDQCHFFAGIGGWSLALRLAGWPDNRPVWTGSCPCQPFSNAGKRKGFADERHLWPIWRELIRVGRPSVVFGEQVASAPEWLSVVRSDLEAMDRAVGALPIQAACAGAFHYRDRYFFVADFAGSSNGIALGHAESGGWQGQRVPEAAGGSQRRIEEPGLAWIVGVDGKTRAVKPGIRLLAHGVSGRVAVVRTDEQTGAEVSHWYNRIGALKAFGNAIFPQVAAEFIKAYGS